MLFGIGRIKPSGQNIIKDRTNLALWFDATKITATDGSQLSSWTDLSVNGWNATQATSANQPIYRASNSRMNNRPSIQFDGSRWFELPSSSYGLLNNVSACSIYGVVSYDSGNTVISSVFSVTGNTSAITRAQIRKSTTDTLSITGRRLDGDTANVSATSTNMYVNTVVVQNGMLEYNSTNTNTTSPFNGLEPLRIYVNNTQEDNDVFPTSGNTSATNSTNIRIGNNVTGSQPLKGYLGELIVYTRAIRDSESTQIYNYLKTKWGI